MNDDAPDFSPGSGYPTRGERIGPAWRAAWSILADGELHEARDLVSLMCASGPIEASTAINLLRSARQRELLAVTYEPVQGRALYRRRGSS